MRSQCRMVAIFVLSIAWWFIGVLSCEMEDVSVYKVKLKVMSDEEHPDREQWTQVFGQTHNGSYSLFHIGKVSKPELRSFIHHGNLDPLTEGGDEEAKVYDQFTASSGDDEIEAVVFLDGSHSLISIISRMVSPGGWFIGVDSLDLCLHSSWVDDIILDLELLDAGTVNDDQEAKPVTKVPHKEIDYTRFGSYYRNPRQTHPVAKAEFIKIKEYSTKQLNDMARKELFKTMSEDSHKTVPRRIQTDFRYKEDITTKNSLQQLKDLEEEPVGTPRPFNPNNNVIVVTKAPDFGDSEELDGDIDTMDEAVLAVANGNKLGLGKHLPRHFKSRLHHAVNRRHGKDCIVSDWSSWSPPCSNPCSVKKRVREVVQERIGKGRPCPPLVQQETCGRCVRGDGDYVW